MPGVEERVMGSRLQSSGCTISTTVATLILRPISSQLPVDKTLDTTLGYLAANRIATPAMREKVNSAFGHLSLAAD